MPALSTPSTTTSSCIDWRYRTVYGANTSVAHLLPGRKDPGSVLRWSNIPTMPTIVWCAAGFSPLTPPFCSLHGRCHRNCPGTWSPNSRICRRHPYLRQLRRIGSSTRCHTSVGLGIGNQILNELKSAETECIENRIHLDWHSAAALQGRGSSPDGLCMDNQSLRG